MISMICFGFFLSEHTSGVSPDIFSFLWWINFLSESISYNLFTYLFFMYLYTYIVQVMSYSKCDELQIKIFTSTYFQIDFLIRKAWVYYELQIKNLHIHIFWNKFLFERLGSVMSCRPGGHVEDLYSYGYQVKSQFMIMLL